MKNVSAIESFSFYHPDHVAGLDASHNLVLLIGYRFAWSFET